jgi:ubiquinone/menaquinone biosynthesis C-methylase UbiE
MILRIVSLLVLLISEGSYAFVGSHSVTPRRTFQLLSSTSTSPAAEPKRGPSSLEKVSQNGNGGLSREETSIEEDRKYTCHKNVEMWRTIVSQGNEQDLRQIAQVLTAGLFSSSAQTRAYWTSYGARTLFFGINGLLASALASNGSGTVMRRDIATAFRVYETLLCYQQELEAIQEGKLNYPWDFPVQGVKGIQWDHRQSNPFFALSESLTLLREAPTILERRAKFQGKPSGQVQRSSASSVQRKSSTFQYPRYYLNDFHYQTDGWLSSSSAQKYEMSSETIFIGSQDVMQRQTILPLKKHFANKAPANLLEVACGTGRLSTFVRDNFPTTDVTLTDLSPFYLEKAKENDDYWRDYRGRDAMREATGISKDPAPVQLLQAQAENLPFADNTFEAVTCVYLFHELPQPIRAKVAEEMARVVKPGGMVVFTDSVQAGDRAALPNLVNFSKFNEPHYRDYAVRTDIGKLFEKHGMVCDEKYVNSRTKTLSFVACF